MIIDFDAWGSISAFVFRRDPRDTHHCQAIVSPLSKPSSIIEPGTDGALGDDGVVDVEMLVVGGWSRTAVIDVHPNLLDLEAGHVAGAEIGSLPGEPSIDPRADDTVVEGRRVHREH